MVKPDRREAKLLCIYGLIVKHKKNMEQEKHRQASWRVAGSDPPPAVTMQKAHPKMGYLHGCGGRIRTCDLVVMSHTS